MGTCRAGIEWVRGHYPEVHHSGAHNKKTEREKKKELTFFTNEFKRTFVYIEIR